VQLVSSFAWLVFSHPLMPVQVFVPPPSVQIDVSGSPELQVLYSALQVTDPIEGQVASFRPLWVQSAPPTTNDADPVCGNDSATAAPAARTIGRTFKLNFIIRFLSC
jgi:hypothetical protein